MKKLLFGLGILPLAALPVLTIVSCGTSNGEIGDGEIPRPDPDSSTDLKITAKPLTQIVIDKAIANFNKNGITDAIKITALQTVFDGVTSEKFKNFEVKAIPTAGTILGTITLTAKPGFSFGIQSSLTSTVILDLKITAIPSTQTTIDKAILDFNSATTDPNKIKALSTVFTGITPENFKNITYKAIPTSGSTPGTITLTPKTNFTINGKNTLTSNLLLDLKITPIKVAQTIIDKSIADFNLASTDANKISALQTTFNGITPANFKNFDVTATPGTVGTAPGTIVLTVKPGFIFGTSKTLSSKVLGTNLDEELDKFSTPVETKTPTTLATEAANSIVIATDATARRKALELLVDLPTLSAGFDFEVKSAKVNTTTDTQIDVSIAVTEQATSTTKNTIFKVIGLKGAPTLDEEAAKFSPTETKTPTTLATDAANSIATAKDAKAKKAALEVLVDLPTLSTGFDFVVKSATVNNENPTSINVAITVTHEAGTPGSKEIIFIVTGLQATPAPTLDEEAAKFSPTETKTPTTLATEAAKSIDDAIGATAKRTALELLVDLPKLSDGFIFIVSSANVNTTNDTSIDVNITLIEQATGTPKDILFIVNGLKATPAPTPTLDEEAAKFTPTETKTPTTLATEAANSIATAMDAKAKKAALELLVDLPTLSAGFDFVVNSATVNAENPTSINVAITVTHATGTPGSKEITFIVTGLKATPAPTLDEEAAKFSPTETKTQTTLATEAAKSIINATDSIAKLKALEALVDLPTLSDGFYFMVTSAKVNATTPTSIDVSIVVTEKATDTTKDITFIVTGLQATPAPTPTLQDQADKFTTFIATNAELLVAEAIKSIDDAKTPEEKTNALKLLATLPVLSSEFTFAFKSVAPTSGSKTSIDVTITITEQATSNTLDKLFTITRFKAAPTLQDQTDHFTTFITTKEGWLVAEAIQSINEATTPETKTAALKLLATLPVLSSEFTFAFKSVAPTWGSKTSIDVTITITEQATSKTLDKFFTITGFKEPVPGPTLDDIAGRFLTPVETKDKNKLALEAAKSINDGTNSQDRLNALKVLADLPALSAGFALIVNSAKVNATTDTSIDVSITIIKETTRTRKDITFRVIGLKGAPTLDREAAKFTTPVATKKPDMSATDAANSITNATDADAKLVALKALANVPILSAGFELIVNSAIVNTTTNTSIDVSIAILQKAGSDAKPVTFTITGLKTTDQPLGITATPTTQAQINKAIEEYIAAETNPNKLIALQTVFDGSGLIEANLANFDVAATPTTPEGKPGTIVLTAKDGFAFGASKTLSSTLIINLDITAKPSIQSVIDKAIANLSINLNPTEEQKIAALQTVFDGITPENFKNINKIKPIVGTEGKPGTITITGKNRVTFNGAKTLTSSLAPIVDLNITAKPSTKEQINQAILDYTYAGNDANKIIALSMLFEGITSDVFSNLNQPEIILSTPDKPGKITLTPKEGYTINNLTSLSSEIAAPTLDEEAAKFKPTKTLTPLTTTTNAIKSINEATGVAAKLIELQKLVVVPTPSDGFTFEVKSAKLNLENPTSIDVIITVTKKATSKTQNVTFTITGLIGDLKITSTPSIQTTIDQAIANFNASGATNANKIAALQTVFAGITIENFKNFNVDVTTTPGTIVLTAKPGFAINGKQNLSSVPLINLVITAKPSTQAIINKVISDFKAAATDAAKIIALEPVFAGSGLIEPNLANFDVTTPTGTPGTIVLKAKSGFVINGQETLSSWAIVDLKITATPSTKEQIDKASWDYIKAQNDNEIITALSTIFIGIDSSDVLAKLEISIEWSTPDKPGKITLTPKEGYTINNLTSLSSEIAAPTLDEEAAKFKPTKTKTPSTTTTNAIESINKATGAGAKLEALKVLVNVPTLSKEFTFEVKSSTLNTENPTSIDVSITVTETATSTTKPITFTITGLTGDLKIKPTPSTQTKVDQVINVINSNVSEAAKTLALQSIFGGLTIENFKNFNVDVTTTPRTIVLTPKPGFVINNGQATLSSVLLIDLKITATPVHSTVINDAIVAINAPEATPAAKIKALSTIFNGITTENFKNFDVATTPGIIVLKANYGYTINGKETLASHSHDAIDLKITVAENKIISQKTIDEAIKEINAPEATLAAKIKALSTIFDGVTIDNFKFFTITATETVEPIPGKVVLTATPGFSFGIEETLTSMIVESLEGQPSQISAKRVPQTIIDDAITVIKTSTSTDDDKIKALLTVFNQITAENFKKFTIEATPTNDLALGKIVLTATPGFIFGNSRTLSSIINLPITARLVDQQVIEDAIAIIWKPEATDETKIAALSTVFDGITKDNFKHFNVGRDGANGYQKLFIAAEPQFAFDGLGTIFTEALPATPPTIEHKINN